LQQEQCAADHSSQDRRQASNGQELAGDSEVLGIGLRGSAWVNPGYRQTQIRNIGWAPNLLKLGPGDELRITRRCINTLHAKVVTDLHLQHFG
jgi:hypothetical protein